MKNRVVITGLGAITPVGNNVETFWQAIKKGQNGIARITAFDPEGFKATLAAEVKDFEAEKFLDKKEAKRMDRYCQFALVAAKIIRAMSMCAVNMKLSAKSLKPRARACKRVFSGWGF
jgi:3-oxoacyl-[acyl-carrier-protein] synthase II